MFGNQAFPILNSEPQGSTLNYLTHRRTATVTWSNVHYVKHSPIKVCSFLSDVLDHSLWEVCVSLLLAPLFLKLIL